MNRTRKIFRQRLPVARRIVPKLRICLREGDPADFPAERNFAMCGLISPGVAEVIVAPKIEGEPAEVIDALLRHELAHAILLFQGHDSHSERAADALAETLWGDVICYDARDVQTLVPGKHPRPAHLPK